MRKLSSGFYNLVLGTILVFLAVKEIDSMVQKLEPKDWIHDRQPRNKLNLISWIVDGCFCYHNGTGPLTNNKIPRCNFTICGTSNDEYSDVHEKEHPPEFQTFDGFSNNIFQNTLGAVGKCS